jgi:hypothetical protein
MTSYHRNKEIGGDEPVVLLGECLDKRNLNISSSSLALFLSEFILYLCTTNNMFALLFIVP